MIDEVRHHRNRREAVLTNKTDCENVTCKNVTTKVSFIYMTLEIYLYIVSLNMRRNN